ncbi:MAG: HD domain-containing protein [Candidatus Thermoplasmatota archaeon]
MSDLYNYGKKEEQTMIKADTGKREKQKFIEDLNEGDVTNDFYAVKIKNPPRPYKKGTWFSFIAADKTGEISVKFWGGENKDHVKRLYDSFNVGDVVFIRGGNVEKYEDKPQISINEKKGGIRRCSPDEYDVSNFVQSLESEKIQNLLDEVTAEIDKVENKQLNKLLHVFFDDSEFIEDFRQSPSAITHHHNYVGGNLEHTVSVIKLCKKICETYPGINKDLLIAGAILHDVGKIKEYRATTTVDKTSMGNFIGHIVLGDRWIRENIMAMRQRGEEFDEELETHLSHMVLSHHGKYEYGSPRLPKTIEACILHQADNMDAQIKNFIQTLEEGRQMFEEEWGFIWDSEEGRKRPFYLREDY